MILAAFFFICCLSLLRWCHRLKMEMNEMAFKHDKEICELKGLKF